LKQTLNISKEPLINSQCSQKINIKVISRYRWYCRYIRRSVIWNTENAILGPGKKNS